MKKVSPSLIILLGMLLLACFSMIPLFTENYNLSLGEQENAVTEKESLTSPLLSGLTKRNGIKLATER